MLTEKSTEAHTNLDSDVDVKDAEMCRRIQLEWGRRVPIRCYPSSFPTFDMSEHSMRAVPFRSTHSGQLGKVSSLTV